MRVWLIMVCALILAACKTDRIFLVEQNSCSAPCWYEITPGKITITETLNLLSAIPGIKVESIRETIVDGSDNTLWWDYEGTIEEYGGVYSRKEVVSAIHISYHEHSLPLDTVIQLFGQPKSILANEQGVEHVYVYAYLNYPEKGISILVRPPIKDRGIITINPDLFVESIWFYNPQLYTDLFVSGPIDRNNPNTIDEKYQNWNGYNDYAY